MQGLEPTNAGIERELVNSLAAWQREQRLQNGAMAERCGISRNYWLQLKSGRRLMTLDVAKGIYHRFGGSLVIQLLAKRFVDEWFAANPDHARAVGAD